MLPGIVDKWRDLVGGLEHLADRPGVLPEEVAEARERLSRLLGTVKMVPEATWWPRSACSPWTCKQPRRIYGW